MDMQLQIPCRRLLLRSASFMMALWVAAALLSPWAASLLLGRYCCWTGGVGLSTIAILAVLAECLLAAATSS